MSISSKNIRPLKQLNDEELIELYKKRLDQAVAGELYNRYTHLAFGACRKYLDNPEDCRDMVMIVFEKILKLLPKSEIRSFKNWLFIIIRNECISSIRKRKSEANKKTKWEVVEKNKETSMENEAIARLDYEEENSKEEQLKIAISMLPKEQQDCIQLFYFDNKSYKEIAKDLNLTDKKVKSYLQNGKRRLKRMLT